jgi:Na+/H+-dicarboxylate symporter
MGRTATNVLGNAIATAVIAKSEQKLEAAMGTSLECATPA